MAGKDWQPDTRRGEHCRLTAAERLERGAGDVAAISVLDYRQALVPSPPFCGARGALQWQQNAWGGDPPCIPCVDHAGLHAGEQFHCFVAFSVIAEPHRCPG